MFQQIVGIATILGGLAAVAQLILALLDRMKTPPKANPKP